MNSDSVHATAGQIGPTSRAAPVGFKVDRVALIAVPAGAFLLARQQGLPRWGQMWVLAFAIFFCCKWLTLHSHLRRAVSLWWKFTYFFALTGMDPAGFFDRSRRVGPPSLGQWLWALSKVAAGVCVVGLTALTADQANAVEHAWLLMIGLILALHFGVFELINLGWRANGVDAAFLMNRPFNSVRLSEFWGQRWNTAFRDLTYQYVFKPICRRWGSGTALFAGFLVSGLIHDAVLSLPAGGGYGLPTIYFCIQAIGLFIERSRGFRRFAGVNELGNRLFTLAFLILPLPLLFHGPFVQRIVVPMLFALKGIS